MKRISYEKMRSIRKALIKAHRNEDWEAAKELSRLKSESVLNAKCLDCGVTINPGAMRCKLHDRLKRQGLRLGFGLVLLSGIVFAGPSPNSGSATVSWNYDFSANPGVTNFVVYYGTSPGNYFLSTLSAGTNLSLTINGLIRGTTYYFVATAMDTNSLESDFSNEGNKRIPNKPAKPANLIAQ